jgi:hypothetical protein
MNGRHKINEFIGFLKKFNPIAMILINNVKIHLEF